MASFKALIANTDTTVLGLTCANSDNPGELGTTLACAMNTADHYLSQLTQTPSAVATGPPAITPVLTPFYEARAILWLLTSQPNFRFGVTLKIPRFES
jgi:hypothetical protein